MTNFYYVVTTKEEINGKEKLYSYMLKVHESNNLLAVINGIKDLHILHQCKTKKQAEELTRKWNNSYKHNGTYLFENEPCF